MMDNIIKHLAEQILEGKVKIESIGNFNNMQDKVRQEVNKLKQVK